MADIKRLIGKTLTHFELIQHRQGDFRDLIIFIEDNGTQWGVYHNWECAEPVTIVSNLSAIINLPITQAEAIHNIQQDVNSEDVNYIPDLDKYARPTRSQTWIYKLGTQKGSVIIRWYGKSNGYYSEEVLFNKIIKTEDGEIYIFDWKEICLIARAYLSELGEKLFKNAGKKDTTILITTELSIILELGYSSPKRVTAYLTKRKSMGYLDIFPWRIPFCSIGDTSPRFILDYIDSDSIYNAAKQRINNENLTKIVGDKQS